MAETTVHQTLFWSRWCPIYLGLNIILNWVAANICYILILAHQANYQNLRGGSDKITLRGYKYASTNNYATLIILQAKLGQISGTFESLISPVTI